METKKTKSVVPYLVQNIKQKRENNKSFFDIQKYILDKHILNLGKQANRNMVLEPLQCGMFAGKRVDSSITNTRFRKTVARKIP